MACRYEPGTNVLETTWMTPHGWAVTHDALTIGPWHQDEHGEADHTRPPTDHEADYIVGSTIFVDGGMALYEGFV